MDTTSLLRRFRAEHGDPPPITMVRAPGRVNLIGEHTDYNLLPVFPMAIQREIRLLVRPRSDARVTLHNVDAERDPCTFIISGDIPHRPTGDWRNYAQAAGQGIVRAFGDVLGLDGVVHGDIPIAAGLSSSSALVVACALALVHVNRIDVTRTDLAELCAGAERYVGTQGGGMDQAICLGGKRGRAFRIDFAPLRMTPVEVPASWRFLVASSLISAEKSGAAQSAYNLRTRECRQALERVWACLHPREPLSTYPVLLARHSIETLVDVATDALDATLLPRFRHVVSEAHRVTAAERAMKSSDLDRFGSLMSLSHNSLRDDYEVSCPELDELVGIACDAGAAGARLTGAGFGGCVVALCAASRVDAVSEALAERFYGPRGVDGDELNDRLLAVEPSDGASVVDAERLPTATA